MMLSQHTLDDLFDKSAPEPNTGCWLWLGGINGQGYGRVKNLGKFVTTHRLSYALKNGGIPDGLWVLHKCDMPLCLNPDHLYAGTHALNTADMVNRGRQCRWNGRRSGEANPRSKLSATEVREIRSIKGMSISALARLYQVSFSSIQSIKAGTTWASVK